MVRSPILLLPLPKGVALTQSLLVVVSPSPPPRSAPPKPPAPKVKPATTADKKPEPEPVTSKDHLERAADLLSDLQVETFSSMDKREKTELYVASPSPSFQPQSLSTSSLSLNLLALRRESCFLQD